jgi:predicted RNase H-like nuclease (RuvC/YqgF family)
LVIFTIFQPNKKIETYKAEIKGLHEKNVKLIHTNDSLKAVNSEIDKELEKIYGIIRITEKLIVQYDNRINDLKNKQNETSNRVNVLNADGVASEFTDYIKKRSGKGVRK